MVAQNTTWALVQRICHVQDILIREPLYGYARSLWDEIPQQAIVAFVLSPLLRAVRMCKVHLGAETLELKRPGLFGHHHKSI